MKREGQEGERGTREGGACTEALQDANKTVQLVKLPNRIQMAGPTESLCTAVRFGPALFRCAGGTCGLLTLPTNARLYSKERAAKLM